MFALPPHEVETIAPPFVADELETARLRLRLFAPADAADLALITSDAEVMEHIADGVPLTADETRSNLALLIEAFRKRGFGRWALVHKQTDRLIGYCGLSSGNAEIGVEIAYLLAKAYWGVGLASEAARACLRYGFEALRLDSIGGVTRPGNARSRRVLERLGMKYVTHGIYYGYDCVHYSITRDEFRPERAWYSVKRVTGGYEQNL